jgi:hypothetical protein
MTTDHAPAAAPNADADAPFLDQLQERMDRIIKGESPNSGRFCGYCYGRLDAEQTVCPFCGRELATTGTVERVPRDALRVYNAHRRKMQLWVNIFAFLGIFLAIVIAGAMVTYLPNPWLWFSVPVLFFGSWYLANLLGGGVGAPIGMRQGGEARAAAWRTLLQRRAAGENLDTR